MTKKKKTKKPHSHKVGLAIHHHRHHYYHWQGGDSSHVKLTSILRMQTGLRIEYFNFHSSKVSVFKNCLMYMCILLLLNLSSKLRYKFHKYHDIYRITIYCLTLLRLILDLTQWTYFYFLMCNRDNIL